MQIEQYEEMVYESSWWSKVGEAQTAVLTVLTQTSCMHASVGSVVGKHSD